MIYTPKNVASAAVTLLALSGCALAEKGTLDAAGVEPIHKAEVTFEERSHPLSFSGGKLAAHEDANLVAFVNASGLTYADRLTLRVSEPNMAADYRHAVNTVIGRYGLAVGNVEGATGLRPGAALLSVSRPTVKLPECGLHTGKTAFNTTNQNMSNYGCATRSNLAAMAANPADLISGNSLEDQSADVTAKPVDAWASHEMTGIKSDGNKKIWTPQGPLPQ